jgi:ubiquinol-cytochrome c reductase cytochrome b subunit
MIGIILGGGRLSFPNSTTSPRLNFWQSIINFPFFWNVYMNLIHYIPSMPGFSIKHFTNKNYYFTYFQTRNYPIFIFLYSLFYTDSIKTISPELIHYFTPVSLAYWIMSNGVSNKCALTLCTDSFTIQEVVLLINILIIKYDLNCSIRKHNNNFRIDIKSMAKLHKLVDPYIIPFSAYKLKNETEI